MLTLGQGKICKANVPCKLLESQLLNNIKKQNKSPKTTRVNLYPVPENYANLSLKE